MSKADPSSNLGGEDGSLVFDSPHKTEVFIGGLPYHVSEADVRRLCYKDVGNVDQIKILEGKGNSSYAFVTFKTVESASKAIEVLNDLDIKVGKIKCGAGRMKTKLYVGNVPENMVKTDFEKAIRNKVPGVESVILNKDPRKPLSNCAFGYVRFTNHAYAKYARVSLSHPDFKIGGFSPIIRWRKADSATKPQVFSHN